MIYKIQKLRKRKLLTFFLFGACFQCQQNLVVQNKFSAAIYFYKYYDIF